MLNNNEHPVIEMQQDCNLYGCDYSYYVLFEAYNGMDAFFIEKQFMTLLRTRNNLYGYNTNDSSKDFSIDQYKENVIPPGVTSVHKRITKDHQLKCNGKTIYFYLRRRMNYTIQEVADVIGITKQAISRWENGDGCPKEEYMYKIASCYNVSVENLNDEIFIKSIFDSVKVTSRIIRTTKNENNLPLFKNIIYLCDKENISLSELERRANLTPRTIYHWDKHIPSTDKVKAVSDYFGISLDEIMREKM